MFQSLDGLTACTALARPDSETLKTCDVIQKAFCIFLHGVIYDHFVKHMEGLGVGVPVNCKVSTLSEALSAAASGP